MVKSFLMCVTKALTDGQVIVSNKDGKTLNALAYCFTLVRNRPRNPDKTGKGKNRQTGLFDYYHMIIFRKGSHLWVLRCIAEKSQLEPGDVLERILRSSDSACCTDIAHDLSDVLGSGAYGRIIGTTFEVLEADVSQCVAEKEYYLTKERQDKRWLSKLTPALGKTATEKM